MRTAQTDDAGALAELEASARAVFVLPADAHVIGEPVTVTQIRYSGVARAGLLATCKRGDVTYELNLADVVFPAASAGASLVARYRTWLGLAPSVASESEGARPHKVEGDDIVVGQPVDLLVLACKSNALRCRLLGSAREVTLRTAVRDETAGSIITVTPKKQWTHARHPYLSGDVTAVRIDASVVGLVPLALHRENAPYDAAGRDASASGRPAYRLAQVAPASDDPGADLLLEAQDCIDARDYAEADELLHKVLALDLRRLDAHAMLGERNLSSWPHARPPSLRVGRSHRLAHCGRGLRRRAPVGVRGESSFSSLSARAVAGAPALRSARGRGRSAATASSPRPGRPSRC